MSLREFGFCFDAQTPSVVKQVVNGLVGDLPVEQFTHARLRFSKDQLEILLRILLCVLQNCLIQLCLELQSRCLLWRKAKFIKHIPPRHMPWFVSGAFHASSPLPSVLSLPSAAASLSRNPFAASPGSFSRNSEQRRSRHVSP